MSGWIAFQLYSMNVLKIRIRVDIEKKKWLNWFKDLCGESVACGEVEERRAGCTCHLLTKWCSMTAWSRRIEQIPIQCGPHEEPLVLTHKPQANVLIVEAEFNLPPRCTYEWTFGVDMIRSELWNNHRHQSGSTVLDTRSFKKIFKN